MARYTDIQGTNRLDGYDVSVGYTAKDLLKDTSTNITTVEAPSYYKTAIAPIDFIMANNLNFCEGNIIKYITRYKEKGGVEDLKKAKNYLTYLIEHYNKKEKFENYNKGF